MLNVKPYTKQEILKNKNERDFIQGIVILPTTIAIGVDINFEDLLDEMSIGLVGNTYLTDISYRTIGGYDGKIIFEVGGCVTDFLNNLEDSDNEQ